ncbi:MAG: hypothetical protein ACI9G1_002113, partial [Pirellulaceae bacterium]
MVVLLFAVFAHVLGNALGSQLRNNGNRPLPNEDGESLEHGQQNKLTDDDFAPLTRLSQYESTGRITLILVALGAALGAAVGTVFFLCLYWEKAEIWNIGAGALAFAVLGGIGTFAAVGFLRTSISALSQAAQSQGAVSEGAVSPRGALPRGVSPRDSLPRDSLPRDSLPRDSLPRDSLPRDSLPRDSLPRDSLPR